MENVARRMEPVKAVVNRVELMGLLGADPNIRKFNNGKVKADLRVAVNENYKKSNGEWVMNTQWHNVTAWGKLAYEVEAHLIKGSRVHVIGKLNNREYRNKAGVTKCVSEILIQQIHILSAK